MFIGFYFLKLWFCPLPWHHYVICSCKQDANAGVTIPNKCAVNKINWFPSNRIHVNSFWRDSCPSQASFNVVSCLWEGKKNKLKMFKQQWKRKVEQIRWNATGRSSVSIHITSSYLILNSKVVNLQEWL